MEIKEMVHSWDQIKSTHHDCRYRSHHEPTGLFDFFITFLYRLHSS